jgi:hypothetical protein
MLHTHTEMQMSMREAAARAAAAARAGEVQRHAALIGILNKMAVAVSARCHLTF